MKNFFGPVLAGSPMLHGPNPTKTRFILKYKHRTLQYLRAHGIFQKLKSQYTLRFMGSLT